MAQEGHRFLADAVLILFVGIFINGRRRHFSFHSLRGVAAAVYLPGGTVCREVTSHAF